MSMSRIGTPSDHFVEFYEDETALVGSIRTFITGGLSVGDGAVLIAQPSRRDAFEFQIQASGTLRRARERGRLVSLDAEETLSLFMVGDRPDPVRFDRSMSEVLSTVARPGSNVRAFGEMVAVLWARGNIDAALALEDIWNDFIERHSMKLFCAYPLEAVGEIESGLSEVCNRHTHVLVPPHHGRPD